MRDEEERNVVSGNTTGILLSGVGTTQNVVAGNYVGVGPDGSTDLGNTASGVNLNSVSNNTIGGVASAARNVISANRTGQVVLSGSTSNSIVGNTIGLNAAGTQMVRFFASGSPGVSVTSSSNSNTIANNVISGNSTGISINTGNDNQITGNTIGLDINATTRIANTIQGLLIQGLARGTRIGTNGDGTQDSQEGNIISGNGNYNINLVNAWDTVVAGNRIGVDIANNQVLPIPAINNVRDSSSLSSRYGTDGSSDAFNANEANIISGSTGDWISVNQPTTSNPANTIIAGNYIGITPKDRLSQALEMRYRCPGSPQV